MSSCACGCPSRIRNLAYQAFASLPARGCIGEETRPPFPCGPCEPPTPPTEEASPKAVRRPRRRRRKKKVRINTGVMAGQAQTMDNGNHSQQDLSKKVRYAADSPSTTTQEVVDSQPQSIKRVQKRRWKPRMRSDAGTDAEDGPGVTFAPCMSQTCIGTCPLCLPGVGTTPQTIAPSKPKCICIPRKKSCMDILEEIIDDVANSTCRRTCGKPKIKYPRPTPACPKPIIYRPWTLMKPCSIYHPKPCCNGGPCHPLRLTDRDKCEIALEPKCPCPNGVKCEKLTNCGICKHVYGCPGSYYKEIATRFTPDAGKLTYAGNFSKCCEDHGTCPIKGRLTHVFLPATAKQLAKFMEANKEKLEKTPCPPGYKVADMPVPGGSNNPAKSWVQESNFDPMQPINGPLSTPPSSIAPKIIPSASPSSTSIVGTEDSQSLKGGSSKKGRGKKGKKTKSGRFSPNAYPVVKSSPSTVDNDRNVRFKKSGSSVNTSAT